MLATPGLPELHVPPETELERTIVPPTHKLEGPDIVEISVFIVTMVVTKQPAEIVYVIVAVPVETPVNTPVLRPMVATAVLLLVHTPPGVVLESVLVAATQIFVSPVITDGTGLTVTIIVDEHSPAV